MKNFFQKMNKTVKRSLVGLVLLATFGFSAYKVDDRLFEIAKNLDVFATMYKELNALYVDEINPTKARDICLANTGVFSGNFFA